MPLEFGVFDHIEPVPGLPLNEIYSHRLQQLERLDSAGFYGYHLAEHHTPAVHSLAPSQNVFLAAAAQRTKQIRLTPCIYVLPLHHPLRLIEEICMLDNLSEGRMELGVGRGGVLEAHFWGQDSDVETNFARYTETLEIVQQGLSHEELNYDGEFYKFDHLPMRLEPVQKPYPPFWYMRNVETAAMEGMNTIIVGSLDSFEANVKRYHEVWEEHQGVGALTIQGTEPKISLVTHLVIAETDEEAVAIAGPAWEHYKWNLGTPRRLEAEKRGLTQFLVPNEQMRPKSAPDREARRDLYWSLEQRSEERLQRRQAPGGLGGAPTQGAGFGVVAGSPASIREYMDEYMETGANYFVGGFQWGDLTHEQAMQSVELFVEEIMPHYAAAPNSTAVI
jgi:alkanesulfonate monooxygenase SsuD/methylene tetrahydromethanopterin reductase-like flavin-dependent oxidoreductase (luciferase family)